MDRIDFQLLELLTADARQSIADIAVMVNLTVEEAKSRIKALEQEGIIMGYGAVINPERLEDDSVSALIEVRVTPQRNAGFDTIAEQLYMFDEVRSCYLMSGDYDLMLIVDGKNIKEVSRFVYERLAILDNVQSCSTHFILKRYKNSGHVFVKKESDKRMAVSP